MQTDNSVLRGAQAGTGGSLTGGGAPGLWPGGVRGTGSGRGAGGDSGLTILSSAPLRRERQAYSMYEPVGNTPRALTPALDPLTGRLQPLSPTVSVSISVRLDLLLNSLFLSGSSSCANLNPDWCDASACSTLL